MRVVFVMLFVIAGFATPVAGQTDQRNAAVWYGRAIKRHDQFARTLSPVEHRRRVAAIRHAVARPDETPNADVAAYLAELQPVLGLVRQAARRPHHDFDLDYDRGAELRLPHLSRMQVFSEYLAAEAIVQLHQGDAGSAADRIESIYRIADQAGRDRLLLSSMVGSETFDLAESLVDTAIDRGQLGPFECASILRALRNVDGGSPFGFAEGLKSERSLMMPWFRTQFSGEGGLPRFRRQFDWLLVDPVDAAAFRVMRQEDLDAALVAAETASELLIETLAIEDTDRARRELRRIDATIRRGDHGPFARLLLGDFADMVGAMDRRRAALRARIELLDAIASGRVDPRAVANAAVWYRRAIAAWNKVLPDARAEVRALADRPAQTVPPSLRITLDVSQPAIDVIREAAAIPRCVFVNADAAPRGLSDEHASLRDLVALLHADAVRWIQAGDFDAVVDRLALAFSCATHLGEDPTIMSSVLAHATFRSTAALVEPGLEGNRFSLAQRRRLLRAARGVGGPDSFGFRVAEVADRARIERWILARWRVAKPSRASLVGEMLAACRGEQLFALALCIDRIERGAAAAEATDRSAAGLNGIIRVAGIAETRRRAADVAAIVSGQRFEELPVPLAAPILRVAERRASAARVVRETLVSLRGEDGHNGSSLSRTEE
ncbi:MAG: hypothetical protein HKN62_12430 [Phycisphaerales bacterium]|nr:hypothetical protein [Phycisphaerales bacterium]